MTNRIQHQDRQYDPTTIRPQASNASILRVMLQHDSADLLSRCLAFLDHPSMLRAAQTNRLLNNISGFDSVWASIVQQRMIALPNLVCKHSFIAHEQKVQALPTNLKRTSVLQSAFCVETPLPLAENAWVNIDPHGLLQIFTLTTNNTLEIVPLETQLNHMTDHRFISATALCGLNDKDKTNHAFWVARTDGSVLRIDRRPADANRDQTTQRIVTQLLPNLASNHEEITAMCFLPHKTDASLWLVVDSNRLLMCNPHTHEKRTVHQCETGNLILSLTTVGNNHLVLGMDDGNLRILQGVDDPRPSTWSEASSHHSKKKTPDSAGVRQVAAYNERYFISAHDDGALLLWDIHQHAQPRKHGGCESPACAMTFDHQQSLMITGHEDGTLRFWDIGGPGHHLRPIAAPTKPHLGTPVVYVNYNDQVLITASTKESAIKTWSFGTR